jgi:hypothetical protein
LFEQGANGTAGSRSPFRERNEGRARRVEYMGMAVIAELAWSAMESGWFDLSGQGIGA